MLVQTLEMSYSIIDDDTKDVFFIDYCGRC